MKLEKMTCPSCGGNLNMKTDRNTEYIYCPYCGQQIRVSNRKNINVHKDAENMAEIIRAENEDKENKRDCIIIICSFVMLFLIFICIQIPSIIYKAQGKIQAGSYTEYIDKNYEAVKEELNKKGFENIETIDMNDAGIFFDREDTVEKISINGDSSFSSSDYFSKEDKVIINYH